MPDHTDLMIFPSASQRNQPSPVSLQSPSLIAAVYLNTEMALHIMSSVERYGMVQLTNEVKRQAQLMATQEGVSDTKKKQIMFLMTACAMELRAVSVQLNGHLLEILQR